MIDCTVFRKQIFWGFFPALLKDSTHEARALARVFGKLHPRPPAEEESSERHLIDRYLDVLIPLGVKSANRVPQLKTRKADDLVVDRILGKAKVAMGTPLVGLFPGAGHPGRRWPLEKFAELADYLMRNDDLRVLVFAGPEEQTLVSEMRTIFPPHTLILDNLTIPELAAALARLAVFVSNDTGRCISRLPLELQSLLSSTAQLPIASCRSRVIIG